MSASVDGGEDLRAAFQRLGEGAELEGIDADLVWRAVSGQLPPQQLEDVVERVAKDPSWALAWRLARELRAASEEGTARRGLRLAWSRGIRYGALAAGLVAATAAGYWYVNRLPEPGYREPGAAAIESLVPEGQGLPRSRCVLLWTGPRGATYAIRATSDDLVRVHTATGLKETRYQVPESFLSAFPPKARLLWRVEARLSDGTVVAGPTFVVRLE